MFHLSHTPVRDGIAKDKIERFFRGCEDQWATGTFQPAQAPLAYRLNLFVVIFDNHEEDKIHPTLYQQA